MKTQITSAVLLAHTFINRQYVKLLSIQKHKSGQILHAGPLILNEYLQAIDV